MSIKLKRAYERPTSSDGYRVLVDRIWPRGISKDKAKLDQWIKEVAPSDDLRKWFHEEPIGRWSEFRRRYMADLKRHRDEMRMLARRAMNENVTLLYSSSDEKHNNAVVIKQYLKMLEAR